MTVKEGQKKATTEEGIKLSRIAKGMLRGTCESCNEETYVVSNLGSMLCAHCGDCIPTWAWGKIEPVFIPEG